MKTLPFWFIAMATLFAVGGMAYGIYMGISQDHSFATAHAHNNLIGWVTMALYGFFCKAVPAAGTTRLAAIHFWISFAGALIFPFGLAMAIAGQTILPINIASILVILGMVIFAYTVWTNRTGLSVS